MPTGVLGVAPSRGRGLKPRPSGGYLAVAAVAPSRGRGLKLRLRAAARVHRRRPLTGARIETHRLRLSPLAPVVAPSRGRGLKPTRASPAGGVGASPPHGGAD